MTALGFLIPFGSLGLIVWTIVGFTKGRGSEPLTLATGAAFYARVLMIGGLLASLMGVAVLIKVGFAFLNPAFSYYSFDSSNGKGIPGPPGGGPIDLTTQREQDLILGITMLVIGAAVVAVHYGLARLINRMPGGSPAWITRGTVLALTVMTALGGLPAAAYGLYLLLTFALLGSSANSQPWGDPIGAAIAFVPAWALITWRLVGQLRWPVPSLA